MKRKRTFFFLSSLRPHLICEERAGHNEKKKKKEKFIQRLMNEEWLMFWLDFVRRLISFIPIIRNEIKCCRVRIFFFKFSFIFLSLSSIPFVFRLNRLTAVEISTKIHSIVRAHIDFSTPKGMQLPRNGFAICPEPSLVVNDAKDNVRQRNYLDLSVSPNYSSKYIYYYDCSLWLNGPSKWVTETGNVCERADVNEKLKWSRSFGINILLALSAIYKGLALVCCVTFLLSFDPISIVV